MAQTLTSILSTRQQISSELQELKDYLHVALDNMARGLAMFGKDQHLILCNKEYGQIYGLTPNLTRPGTPLEKIIRAWVPGGEEAVAQELGLMLQKIHLASEGRPRHRTQHLPNGRVIRVTLQSLPGGGWVDVQEDVTEYQHKEAELLFASSHDELTKLANRTEFTQQVTKTLAELAPGEGFAVHTVLIGSFQAVIGAHGLAARDRLVQDIGRRLTDVLRPTDLIARLDGDLFGIIQPKVAAQNNIEGLRARLYQALSGELDIGGRKMEVQAHIGSVFAPRDGGDVNTLLNGALSMPPAN